MDWFYPVLSGPLVAVTPRARDCARWHEFVDQELGCRCVADQPWVTIAETCELVLACLAAEDAERAATLFEQPAALSGRRWLLVDGVCLCR